MSDARAASAATALRQTLAEGDIPMHNDRRPEPGREDILALGSVAVIVIDALCFEYEHMLFNLLHQHGGREHFDIERAREEAFKRVKNWEMDDIPIEDEAQAKRAMLAVLDKAFGLLRMQVQDRAANRDAAGEDDEPKS